MSEEAEPAEETSHITSVRTQWRLRQQAARKPHFKIVDGEIVRYAVSAPADDLATTVADAAAAEKNEREAAEAAIIANAEIGQMIKGRGIFAGTWEPKDREGNSLGKIFNVFAAPQDLTEDAGQTASFAFTDAVKCVGALKNWHGHDGKSFNNDTELYDSLRDGSYDGEWFIPTLDLLGGKDVDGVPVQAENLYKNKEAGDLSGALSMTLSGYWSCTQDRTYAARIWALSLSDGRAHWYAGGLSELPVRPVRVELRASGF